MKTLVIIILLSFIASCGITQGVKRRPASKPHRPVPTASMPPSHIVGNVDEVTIVQPEWVVKYFNLEAHHGPIPEDIEIERYGKNFKITQAVRDHYMDMKRTQ